MALLQSALLSMLMNKLMKEPLFKSLKWSFIIYFTLSTSTVILSTLPIQLSALLFSQSLYILSQHPEIFHIIEIKWVANAVSCRIV